MSRFITGSSRVAVMSVLTIVILVVTSCASGSQSESDESPGTKTTSDSLVDDAVTATTVVTSDFVSERELDIELDWGGNITIEVAIGAVTTLSDPDNQIASDCALNDLPEPGTSFQRLQVTVKSNSTRDIRYPRVQLGTLIKSELTTNPLGQFHKIHFRDVVSFESTCILKEDVGFSEGDSIGFFEYPMSPGTVASFRVILMVKPGAPQDWQYALYVSPDDESYYYQEMDPDGMSPGELIIGLHNVGRENLRALEISGPSENLIKKICEAAQRLKPPAEEPPDSENLMILAEASGLNSKDYELATAAFNLKRYYEDYPDYDWMGIHYPEVVDECQEYGH